MTSFQKILLIQALRPDRLESALLVFVCESLGVQTVSPPPPNLNKIYEEESQATEPILLITTPGADPSQELEEFALKVVGRDHYLQVWKFLRSCIDDDVGGYGARAATNCTQLFTKSCTRRRMVVPEKCSLGHFLASHTGKRTQFDGSTSKFQTLVDDRKSPQVLSDSSQVQLENHL